MSDGLLQYELINLRYSHIRTGTMNTKKERCS
jgi:hypothetical protein